MSNLEDNETEVNEFDNENEETKEMGFWDHLGELRIRLFYSTIGILLGCMIAGYFVENIMDGILLKPAVDAHLDLQNLRVFGKPMLYFKVVMIVGFILSFPFTLYQLWKFIEPALYTNEKGWAKRISFFTTLCFFSGVVFAYKVMIPSMLQFSASFGTDKIKNLIDINEYWGFIMLMILSAGIFFEMPMVSFVLTRFGLLTPRFLRKYRRHSIIVILIVAAVITPSPDPFNQMIVAVPIYILYEISIFVSQFTLKKHFTE
ncbi:MAG: twin-arginine translocase subunit TatC [Candidatus Kapabacteria bacterium]|nr:twin-arginine translocase subunit TatC [Candidatus Kapabacteria bacterium]